MGINISGIEMEGYMTKATPRRFISGGVVAHSGRKRTPYAHSSSRTCLRLGRHRIRGCRIVYTPHHCYNPNSLEQIYLLGIILTYV